MGTAGQSVTLANSIIGVGILAMPFCFQQCGAALAVLMLLLSSLVSRLACYFLLKSAIMARRRNFEFLAFHVFGASGKLAVEIGIIGFLMGTCIAYFVVVGDLGPQIISKMFNINQSDVLRTCVMVLVSLVCVLPLGLLRNVDSLSNVSAATIGFYFCLIFKVMAEAASQLFTGNWWSKIELWKPEGVLQCVPIFSMALFCQTQLFEIFETLPSLSLEKMNLVTKNALNICTTVYLMVGMFGYIAFCAQPISGNILVSLSPTMASDVIKLGFVMSLAFSFPLIIFPCRASLYSLLYRKVLPSHHDHIINHSIPEGTFRCITVGIVAISLLVSLMIPNIELVLGLVGSTIGVVVCVLFPAACFVNLTIKNTNERLLAKIILCLGFIVMILGTYANLQAAESKLDHYDDRYITQDKIDEIVHDFLETNKQRFKLEDANIKPEIKLTEASEEHHKSKVQVAEDKNSEVQPPNPVAPDPHSDESKKADTPPILKPGNKGKLEQHEIEGAGDKEAAINIIDNNKTESEEKKIKAIKEAVKEKEIQHIVANSVLNQDNLKILKEQALIETIKQHGEEQKELIKEQKSILDELKKTKLEIEMKKKESLDKEQANKIAVESIQKIANIAIKSLSGVTDKPNGAKPEISLVDNESKLSDPSHLLQEAVQSIESIVKKAKPETGVAPGSNIQPLAHVDSENTKNKVELKPEVTANSGGKVQPKNRDPVVSGDKNHIHRADEPKSYVQGEDIEKLKQIENKLSPSEIDALIKNVPVPMVMNPSQAKIPNVNDNQKPVTAPQNAVEPPIIEKGNAKIHSRDKRNVVDCSKQNFISEEDRKRCRDLNKTSIADSGIDIKIPQKLSVPEEIDLGKVNLFDQQNTNVNVRHHSRALKSVNESEPS